MRHALDLSTSIGGLLAFAFWIGAWAPASGQCPNDNVLSGAALTIPCPGTLSPVPCLRAGRYLLVNVNNGRTYTFASCGTTLFDTYLTLLNNSGGALLAFNDDACGTQSSITWTATFTGQVRLLMDQTAACNNTTICTSVHISCSTAAPTNDLICNATPLPVNASCSNLSPSPTNVRATNTAGPPAPGCADYLGGDIWFSLVVPAGGSVTVRTRSISSSAVLDAGIAAYSSSDNTCTGTLALLNCHDDIDFPYNEMSELSLSGLTPGNTIFIRVWEAGNDLFGRFNICAFVTPPLPDAPCSAIAIPVGSDCEYQNFTNVSATTTNPPAAPSCGSFAGARDVWYSFTGPANGRVVLQTDQGTLSDACMALYSTNTGTCAGTFTQIACDDDGGEGLMPYLYRTGLTPGTTYWVRIWGFGGASGTFQFCVFSPVGTRLEDCIGSTTVCDDQYVQNTSLFTGTVSDLTGANRGCLASSERQGTWYVFSINTGGNLGMTITPLANDDYDFALWGPYPAGSLTSTICVPASAPIRCSYASGANTFAATGSYNTGMGNSSFVTPQFTTPATCPSCTEGAGANGWISGLTVTAGQVYLLYVSNFSQSGSAFTLGWDLSGGTTLGCTVLPVEYLSIRALASGTANLVEWSTATEQYSAYFEVQRADGSMAFETIGTLEASGGSQQRIDYSFRDEDPLEGANYYRLKQVDTDGAYELSPVVVAFRAKPAEAPLVFPNPARDILYVPITVEAAATTYLQVLDAAGRVVRDRDLDLVQGAHTVPIPLDGLPSGAYELRLHSTSSAIPVSTRFLKE